MSLFCIVTPLNKNHSRLETFLTHHIPVYVDARVIHAQPPALFTVLRLAFWPARWPTGSVQTELQDSSFLITGSQKELFVAAVPPRSIATLHCLGLSFNRLIRRFLYPPRS